MERDVPWSAALGARPRIDAAAVTESQLRIEGAGFQESAFPAPVVSVMSLANEQLGQVAMSGPSDWSDAEIRAGLGDLPPGLVLLVVRDARGGLTATVLDIDRGRQPRRH